MKHLFSCLALASSVLFLLPIVVSTAEAQATSFSYQGQLTANGAAANGSYDLGFSLYDAASAGAQVGLTVTNPATGVTNGLFTVALDFGSAPYTGQALWLQIAVSPAGSNAFTTLTPLQPLTATPYAVQSLNTANFSGAVALSQLPGEVVTNGESGVTISGNGGGLTNVPGTLPWQVSATTNVAALPNQGYLLTNAGSNSVTLPTNASLGDIVTITGTGSNGWQAVPGPGQFIQGFGFPAGTVWTAQNSGFRLWSSVASSSNGNKLVATVSPGLIYTSGDSGVTWTARNSGSQNWACITSSADGTKLAAGVGSGQVYTSTDSGVTWTARTNNNVNGVSIASSANGTKLVAAGTGRMFTSIDSGVTWTVRTTGLQWQSVASSTNGNKLVAGISGVIGGGPIYTSGDSGVTWTAQNVEGQAWPSIASSADGAKLVASGGVQLYTSGDSGVTWTAQYVVLQYWVSVASSADGSKLVAVPEHGLIYTSGDSGVTWTAQNSGSQYWTSVASSADGSKLVAVTQNGQIYTSAAIPPSLPTTEPAGATAQFQYIGNGFWQPVEDSASLIAGVLSPAQLPGIVVTNTETGVTLSGTFTGALIGNAATASNFSGSLSGDVTGTQNATVVSSTNVALLNRTNQIFTGAIIFSNIAGVGFDGRLNVTNIASGGGVIVNANGFDSSFSIAKPGGVSADVALAAGPGSYSQDSQINDMVVRTATTSQRLILQTGPGHSAIFISSANNVGIGNINPANLLVVGGSASPAYCNGTTWQNGSDRNIKRGFHPINNITILDKVLHLPITQWQYDSEGTDVQHIGPMAQDFHAAFGVNGSDDTHISTVDEGGVALAAIKGLNQKIDEKDAKIAELENRLQSLEKAVALMSGNTPSSTAAADSTKYGK